jgi:hypothetical protein
MSVDDLDDLDPERAPEFVDAQIEAEIEADMADEEAGAAAAVDPIPMRVWSPWMRSLMRMRTLMRHEQCMRKPTP